VRKGKRRRRRESLRGKAEWVNEVVERRAGRERGKSRGKV
jgi:hypothetical protein